MPNEDAQFLRAFKDNADQTDIQVVAEYLRKKELNEEVINDIVILMYEHQTNWSCEEAKIVNWLNSP